ncbi:MAG: 2-C-methyl-D-erythritol 2,4-cyclodiphosphate synthase [Clostridia bacterium]|nr:2-C-methyl-D-erythritol 2,4-cyclodiphosphate synthase [Clostridia bacterium]
MWYALLLAGGSGSRMQAGMNKVLLPLQGMTILARSALTLSRHVDGLVAVIRPEDMPQAKAILESLSLPCPLLFAEGGDTRQASVKNGMKALTEAADYLLIHDAARCLVTDTVIEEAKACALRYGSGIPSVPVIDTIKIASADGWVRKTPDRASLYAMQTPQAVARRDLESAMQTAEQDAFLGTDDASLLEHAGMQVHLSPGDPDNLKITRPQDMEQAKRILAKEDRPMEKAWHVGHGYDVHRLTDGRKLILCGVEIPYAKGLDGHSDADVALHALMDAMLGSVALGDIGHLFPDTDNAYLGISSMVLLQKCREALHAVHASVSQLDLTIVAQSPKLAPYVPAMRENISHALALPLSCVSVKATTTEHLGFEGRGEGISATAVVMTEVVTDASMN